MLDTYTTGHVSRISPEAPVPVLHVENIEHLPGGAGNVALNLISLGASVRLLGRIGSDLEGKQLATFLTDEGIDTKLLFVERNYHTPLKSRLIGSGQQIVRLDRETISPLSETLEEEVIRSLDLTGVDIIAISDYGKGFLTNTLLEKLIALAKKADIPVVVDPKGDDFSKYRGATLIKPNLKEAIQASTLPQNAPLDRIGANLLEVSSANMIMITRSQDGISLFQDGDRLDSPVKAREILDVTGAGDTVLATITIALASDVALPDALTLCNLAAGIAIEHVGCKRVALSDLAARLLEFDAESKIFTDDHLIALKHALKDRPHTLFTIDTPLTPALYAQMREKGAPGTVLIVYTPSDDPDFLSMLASLKEVDFILTSKESIDALNANVPV